MKIISLIFLIVSPLLAQSGKSYPVRIYTVATVSSLSYSETQVKVFGKNSLQVGDIISNGISINKLPGFGRKRQGVRIYIAIEGIERLECTELNNPDKSLGEKRRYSIPLERIKEMFPSFDIDRAKDKDDVYQPFLNFARRPNGTYEVFGHGQVFRAEGLIFDKQSRKYVN